MTPAQLSRTVLHSLRGVVDDAGWPELELPARAVVESPPRRGSGDYATGAALQIGRSGAAAGRPPQPESRPRPRVLAQALAERLAAEPGVGRAEVSGPGFVNVTLDAMGRAALVRSLAGPDRSGPDLPARDAARWAAATGDDPAALYVRTDASPLFRVQYAHARTRQLLRNAADLGLSAEAGAGGHAYEAPAERTLLALLADQRRIAEAAGSARLARHLVAVADSFRDLHDACGLRDVPRASRTSRAPHPRDTSPPGGFLPSGTEKPGAAHRARLALAEATGTVLAGGLSQLGVTSPAHL